VSADEDYAFGLYPDGSGVLRNKLGLRTAEALREAEYQASNDRHRDAPDFPPTRAGYQALHRHLFEEVFEWAGELRTVDFGKLGSRFGTARFLDVTLDTLFADLARQDHLRGRTGERFAEGAAHHVSELNIAHPFREGNGRAMRLHLSQLAAQAGHTVDVTRIGGAAWEAASIRAFEGDERPLAGVIAMAIGPDRWVRPEVALEDLRGALEPSRLEIVTRTSALRDQLAKTGLSDAVREEIRGLRTEMERLRAADTLAAPLAAQQGSGSLVPVRAGASASPRDLAHAILAAAGRLPTDAATSPEPPLSNAPASPAAAAPTAVEAVQDALRRPPPDAAAPWDAGLTPLAPRLAAYMQRKTAEAAAAAAPTPPAPGATSEPLPAPPAPKRDRDPSPGF